MAQQVQREGDGYRIEWDDDVGAVVHYWTKFTTGQDFRDGANELLEVLRSRDTSKMIVDTSGIQAHDEEDKEWLTSVWIHEVSDAGIDNSAVVHPDSVIAKMEMDDFAQELDGLDLTQYNTSSMQKAKDWLADK